MGCRARQLGILRAVANSFLIASLIHIPLPQPDFHNIRHHDGPGEICRYHDHLLRWHPSASRDIDVSVLHWHWVVPALDGTGQSGNGNDDSQHQSPVSGPAFHAHVGDALEPDWSNAMWLSSESATTRIEKLEASTLSILGPFEFLTTENPPLIPHPIDSNVFSCAHSPSRQILQRWNC